MWCKDNNCHKQKTITGFSCSLKVSTFESQVAEVPQAHYFFFLVQILLSRVLYSVSDPSVTGHSGGIAKVSPLNVSFKTFKNT